MKLFLDSAHVEEVREAWSWGIIDGVTTNPSHIAKTGRRFREVVAEICEIVDGPISAEAVSLQADEIVKEAREIASIHPNIVVKVPLIKEGIKALKVLSQEGIRTNLTLCFSANQALLAAKLGATYISPFVGRLDPVAHDGMELVRQRSSPRPCAIPCTCWRPRWPGRTWRPWRSTSSNNSTTIR